MGFLQNIIKEFFMAKTYTKISALTKGLAILNIIGFSPTLYIFLNPQLRLDNLYIIHI